MPHLVIIIGIILAASFVVVMAGLIIIFFFTCLLEKRHIKQFVPCDPSLLTTSSFYCSAVTQQAAALGFTDLGTFAQDRGSRVYSAVIGYWVAPEGTILAVIAGGKTAKVPIKITNLISWSSDGRQLMTSDKFVAPYLSGLTDKEVVLNAHLPELYGRHRQRLVSTGFEAQIIPRENICAVRENMEMATYSRLQQMGLARPVNPEGTIWNLTVKGAWQMCNALIKQMGERDKQRERTRLKRPGDA